MLRVRQTGGIHPDVAGHEDPVSRHGLGTCRRIAEDALAVCIAGLNQAPYSPRLMHKGAAEAPFPHRHLLGIDGLSPDDVNHVLDLADGYVELNRQAEKKRNTLRGRTIINCFFESSTRTRTSFELAGKRLGGDVINMSVPASARVKGETLIDTAMTLNAMHPDVLVVRHPESVSYTHLTLPTTPYV